MPFDAKVYRLMIASPGDVEDARQAVRRAVERWNGVHSMARGAVVLPIAWDTSSAPALGDRPQAIINAQLGICDLLVGVFWTRLGTPTGVSSSGTIEEIDRHLRAGSKVMLYFSRQQVAPGEIDTAQLDAVRDAKAHYRKLGVVWDFENAQELEGLITHQLSIHMNEVTRSAHADPAASPKAGPTLSEPARELLRAAAKDPGGLVLKYGGIEGTRVQTNRMNMTTSGNPREHAKWVGALDELIAARLVATEGRSGNAWKVTDRGYSVADTL